MLSVRNFVLPGCDCSVIMYTIVPNGPGDGNPAISIWRV